MSDATLNSQLQALRLSQMKTHWKPLEQQAIAAGWAPANFLSQLYEQELEHRLQQRHRRYFKESRLPSGKTLNTLELSSLQGINPSVIGHLSDQHEDRKSVV